MELPQEALDEYLSEGEEILQRVMLNITLVEKLEHGSETLVNIYRDMHTLKGSSMLFGFNNVGEVSHVLEACLDPVRKTGEIPGQDFMNQIYKCLDLIEKFIESIRADGKETETLSDEKIDTLSLMIEVSTAEFGKNFKVGNESIATTKGQDEREALEELKLSAAGNQEASSEKESAPAVNVKLVEDVVASAPAPEVPVVEAPKVETSKVVEKKMETARPAEAAAKTKGVAKDSSVRVNVELLDRMMNLVGELVLIRNQVRQYSSQYDDSEFINLSQNLNIVTSDLQAEVMKTRMQPIGNILNKFTRIVRDIATDLNKNIRLELEGVETELDKTLLEAIRDPLTHIIRNSCDHGIEMPEERESAGKSVEGHLVIKSYHEGGQVVIEINDDGRGLQKSRIIDKALERGLVDSVGLKRMSDRDIYDLVMMPGFSTAEKVSSVSGRGVGMDVVKTNIEKIGGSVEINSTEGRGTQLKMKIPLTLAIVPAMLVRVADQKYCIPQIRLVELVRVDSVGGKTNSIEFLQGQPIFRLRGDILPLVNLESVLGPVKDGDEIDYAKSTVNIVVLSTEGSYFGLIVDEILDTADIVVKPLSQFLKTIGTFSGATIMGDGSVSLILDIVGLSECAHMAPNKEDQSMMFEKASLHEDTQSQEFLTFSVGQQNKYAIPLCLVHRLEKFSFEELEYSGSQQVVQYRGDLLPIVNLREALGFPRKEKTEAVEGSLEPEINVIVSQKAGMYFGVEVDNIEDVVLVNDEINESVSDREGLLGNIIYNEQVIVVADVLKILGKVVDEISVKSRLGEAAAATEDIYKVHKGAKLLLAEDTPFFRRKITSVLTNAGYNVVAANNGQEAIDILEKTNSDDLDLVVSDIEMPYVDGYGLAESVRKNSTFNKVPMIAVTTKFRDRDILKGKESGFNEYIEKLNEEELLKTIDKLLSKGE